MKILVPPIVRPVDLAAYAPEIKRDDGGAVLVYVWVNPPVRVLDEYDAIRAEIDTNSAALAESASDAERVAQVGQRISATGQRLADWYSRLWSQGPDGTHWTAADVRDLGTSDTDPALYPWLRNESWRLIREHRELSRKK